MLELILQFLGLLADVGDAVETATVATEEAGETADATTEALDLAKTLAREAAEVMGDAEPIMQTGAKIPVEPLPDMKPAAEALEILQRGLKAAVPTLVVVGGTVGLLGGSIKKIKDKLRRLFWKKRPRTVGEGAKAAAAQPALFVSAAAAHSVAQQIKARYGEETPPEMKQTTEALSGVAKRLLGHKPALEAAAQAMTEIGDKLSLLHPFHDTAQTMKALLSSVQGIVHGMLGAAAPLIKCLKRANKYFKEIGRLADGEIKKALRAAHIDPGFIDRLKQELKSIEAKIVNELTKPLKQFQSDVESAAEKLSQPLSKALAGLTHLETALEDDIDHLIALLDAYVADAAKIGIKPKTA